MDKISHGKDTGEVIAGPTKYPILPVCKGSSEDTVEMAGYDDIHLSTVIFLTILRGIVIRALMVFSEP